MEGTDNGTCETCRPDGLIVRKVNGVTQVEVPSDFMSAKLGGSESQIAQALSIAERARRTERSIDPANAHATFRPIRQESTPSSTTQLQRTVPNDLLILAETDSAEVLGHFQWHRVVMKRQFTLAETDAADVVSFQVQEGGAQRQLPRRLKDALDRLQKLIDEKLEKLNDKYRKIIEEFLRSTIASGPHHWPLADFTKFRSLPRYDPLQDAGVLGDETCTGQLRRSIRYGVLIDIPLVEVLVGEHRQYYGDAPVPGSVASQEQAKAFAKGQAIAKEAQTELSSIKKDHPINFDEAAVTQIASAIITEVGLPKSYLIGLVEDGYGADPGIAVTCPDPCVRIITIEGAHVTRRSAIVTHSVRTETWGDFKDSHGNPYKLVRTYVGLYVRLAYDIIINFRVDCLASK